jgi:hypothetical protein
MHNKDYTIQIWDDQTGHWNHLENVVMYTRNDAIEYAKELSEWRIVRVVQVSLTITYQGKPAVLKSVELFGTAV